MLGWRLIWWRKTKIETRKPAELQTLLQMFTRYDQMTGKELKAEATKRFGTNTGLKPGLPINRNQSGYKYRLILIQDDVKKGIDPYRVAETQSLPSGTQAS